MLSKGWISHRSFDNFTCSYDLKFPYPYVAYSTVIWMGPFMFHLFRFTPSGRRLESNGIQMKRVPIIYSWINLLLNYTPTNRIRTSTCSRFFLHQVLMQLLLLILTNLSEANVTTGPTFLKREQRVLSNSCCLIARTKCPIKATYRRRGLSWRTIQVS